MLVRILVVMFLFQAVVSAEDRLAEYYHRAIPAVERFLRLFPDDSMEPTGDFAVFTLFNNIAILASAHVDLPKEEQPDRAIVSTLLRIAEEMQEKNPESRHFGNFRWYWNTAGVTDPNAAEFAVARMLSIYLDTPDSLSDEDRVLLIRLLERALQVCLNRRIPPDYTNIAFYNAIHLILLGQVLDRPDVFQEGKRRLYNIVAHIWNHGIFEYNSPAYYFINVDSLQLGFRHVQDEGVQQIFHALLELFWTDLSLHWYKPGLRLAGAQSRTYNYLYGTNVHMFRLFSFAGLSPYDHDARYHAVLNSFRALYQPPPNIVKLNAHYPRWVTRNWGKDPGQWAAMYMTSDIALGTAGTKYNSMQNMVQTVDMPDDVVQDRLEHGRFTPQTWQFKPRSYFIADGREDPYGTKLYSTGSGGQQKPLHLDALWFGAQWTVDSLGIVLYPPEAIADPVVMNVQSHFVVRKPKSIWMGGKLVSLASHQSIGIGDQPIVFRYETCAFGIRTIWTRDQEGKTAKTFLVDDGNEHGVYRLTVEHGVVEHNKAISPPPGDEFAGAAFWVRIGSRLETDEQFADWHQQFITATVHRLDVKKNNIAIEVAGQEGSVSIEWIDSLLTTEPAAPMGILTLDGNDLGRPILETIPEVAAFTERRNKAEPITIHPSATYWEAESGYSFSEGGIEPDASASGGLALRINQSVSWQLQLEKSGNYFLWGRVQTRDTEHDSFYVETAKRLPDHSFMRRTMNVAWHLGVHENWTWVRLPAPLHLEKGRWQLTLKPREQDGRIDQLFLTTDPAIKP